VKRLNSRLDIDEERISELKDRCGQIRNKMERMKDRLTRHKEESKKTCHIFNWVS